jgi:putative ABC transport system permease protein
MFFLRYLRCELRSRARQAVFIALGLALGVGLVVTVTAASSGVNKAQGGVLQGLYGIGTDVTVTKKPPPFNPGSGGGAGGSGGIRMTMGPNGKPEVCQGSHCSTGAQTIDTLTGSGYAPLDYSTAASIGKLHGVSAVGAGLVLTDRTTKIPANMGAGGAMPSSDSFDVDGVDFAHSKLGPLSNGTLTSGRNFSDSDASSNVAVVDSGYAAGNSLKAGSTVKVDKVRFTIIGIVSQPQSTKPADVYIPLARAQALGTSQGNSLKNKVNTIYVAAASAKDIPAVQKAIKNVVPSATVTSASSLASQVTGSLASTARLANDLGRWLSILVLIAAFAVAILLTMAAVTRRVREFGTLKALGWRSLRIIAQVMGEAVAMGVAGAAAGIGLGFAGAAIIDKIAPKLSATVQTATGQRMMMAGAGGTQSSSPTVAHTVSVPMSASVTTGAIVAAVVLAIAGALLAGSFGSWRIAQLRPADALSRVA